MHRDAPNVLHINKGGISLITFFFLSFLPSTWLKGSAQHIHCQSVGLLTHADDREGEASCLLSISRLVVSLTSLLHSCSMTMISSSLAPATIAKRMQ